jgi:hypothetical protein
MKIIIFVLIIVLTLCMLSAASLGVMAAEPQTESAEPTSADDVYTPIETRRELLFPFALGIIIVLGIIMYVFVVLPQRNIRKEFKNPNEDE